MVMTGEWWITDSGQAIFADGDIGDCNHEGVVIDHIVPDIAELAGLKVDDDVDLQAFVQDFNNLMDERAANKDGGDIDIESEMIEMQLAELYKNKEQAKDAWECVFNYSKDAREYACKWLGWIRVAGNTMQTQTLTRAQLKRIGDGLVDIHEEERLDGEEWDIHVMGNQKMYYDVPTHVILKGDPVGLLPYRQDASGPALLP